MTAKAERRAKYSQDDRDKMAMNGQAMIDGSYPVADVDDLKNAIRAVGRGNNRDATRKHIIVRADALGHRDLTPDNWNGDGSLKETSAAWSTPEQRETYNDIALALQGALDTQVPGFCWVQDFDDDNVYYYSEGSICSAPYSVEEGGPVNIGAGQAVRPVTSYVPANRSEKRALLPNTVAARKQRMPKAGDLEHRTLPVETLELRDSQLAVRDGDGDVKLLEFTGYASVFERAYNVGPYEERIARGAFKRSLSNQNLDVVLRTEHNSLPLARTTGRITLADGTDVPTLMLSEDDVGLEVRALLDPTDPDVQRLVPKYRRGDLKEMSFAFRCSDDVWSDDYASREIRQAELHRGDVSIVTYGASSVTNSALRSEEAVQELRNVGAEGMVGSLQDFAFQWVANYLQTKGERATIQQLEARIGKVLSSPSMDTLMQVLALVATADQAVDEAQPLLADLMGVPNPDADDTDSDDDGEQLAAPGDTERAVADLPPARYDEFEIELRALESR